MVDVSLLSYFKNISQNQLRVNDDVNSFDVLHITLVRSGCYHCPSSPHIVKLCRPASSSIVIFCGRSGRCVFRNDRITEWCALCLRCGLTALCSKPPIKDVLWHQHISEPELIINPSVLGLESITIHSMMLNRTFTLMTGPIQSGLINAHFPQHNYNCFLNEHRR